MNAPFQLGLLACQWTGQGDTRDWLDVYRQAEAQAERAAAAVRAACAAFKAARSPETQAAYAAADRAYDAARLQFQMQCRDIVNGIRAIAGIAREAWLADASAGRML